MRAVRLWILWSVFCSGAGWLLSSIGQLNRLGYSLLALAVLAGSWMWRRSHLPPIPGGDDVRRLTSRSLGSPCSSPSPHPPQACRSRREEAATSFRQQQSSLLTSAPTGFIENGHAGSAREDAPTSTLHSIRHRALRRFRRPLPLAFGILAVLVLAGGMLHEPNNGDTMGYRLPRVLHWLAEQRWHWIHADDARLNVAAPGWEWLAAPMLLFCKSDRPLFLINWLPFLLLPGLTFSLLGRLGVSRRAAWYWMWILPSGYCFVMQAGSVCNDSFTATYALAAMVLALRGSRANAPADLGYSLLAAALLTGAKQTNLPLLLPWTIAFSPGLWRFVNVRLLGRSSTGPRICDPQHLPPHRNLRTVHEPPLCGAAAEPGPRAGERCPQLQEEGLGADSLRLRERVRVRGNHPSLDPSGNDFFPPEQEKNVPPPRPSFTFRWLATAAVCLLAAAVSLLPNVLFNLSHTGIWTGVDHLPFRPESAGWGVAANLWVLPLQNLVPPIFPWAEAWNHLMQSFVSTPLGTHFRSFESFGKVARAAHELSAGLGSGVCLLAILSALGAGRIVCSRRKGRSSRLPTSVAGGARDSGPLTGWNDGRDSEGQPSIDPIRARQAGRSSALRRPPEGAPGRTWRFWLCVAPWLAALVLMTQMALWQVGRYFSAYYPLLLPLLLLSPRHELLTRRPWWRALALLVVASVIPLVILSRSRPLWPVDTVLSRLEHSFPNSGAVHKARLTFAFSAGFNRTLQPLLDLLPAGEQRIGYAAAATSHETSLWRPFGQRRVLRVRQTDAPETLSAWGLRFVFVELDADEPETIQAWCRRYQSRVRGQAAYRTEPEAPEQYVYLVELPAHAHPTK